MRKRCVSHTIPKTNEQQENIRAIKWIKTILITCGFLFFLDGGCGKITRWGEIVCQTLTDKKNKSCTFSLARDTVSLLNGSCDPGRSLWFPLR